MVPASDWLLSVADQRAASRHRVAEVWQVLGHGGRGEPERGQESGQPSVAVQDLAEQEVTVVGIGPSLSGREQRPPGMSHPQEHLIRPGPGW
jgi:hypothetical protein